MTTPANRLLSAFNSAFARSFDWVKIWGYVWQIQGCW